ncbi:MAG: HAMP domain-containing protein, partial [Alphaproteobacteria bacterium]|nr:HAMP domain-containing protein [Alphaproteobacteria bacterium]
MTDTTIQAAVETQNRKFYQGITAKLGGLIILVILLIGSATTVSIVGNGNIISNLLDSRRTNIEEIAQQTRILSNLQGQMGATLGSLNGFLTRHQNTLVLRESEAAPVIKESRVSLQQDISSLAKSIDSLTELPIILDALYGDNPESELAKAVYYIQRSLVTIPALFSMYEAANDRTLSLLGVYRFDEANSSFLYNETPLSEALVARINKTALVLETAIGEIIQESDRVNRAFIDQEQSEATKLQQIIIFASIAVSALVLVLSLFLARSQIVRPLLRLTEVSAELSQDKTDVKMPRARKDEIGDIIQAFHIFRQGIIDRHRLQEEQVEREKQAEAEKKQAMIELADNFEQSVKGIVEAVSAAATEMSSQA